MRDLLAIKSPKGMRGRALSLPWRWWHLRYGLKTLVQAVGATNADAAARALARRVYEFNPPVRQTIDDRLASCLPRRSDRQALSLACLQQMARFWVELAYIPRQLGDSSWRGHVNVADAASWERLRNRSGGLIVATPPLGNPAVAAVALSGLIGPITVVADILAQRLIRAIEPRISAGGDLCRWPGLRIALFPHAGRQVNAALERNETVLFVAGPQSTGGIACDFLGCAVRWPAVPARLSHRHGVPLILAVCRRGPAAMRFQLGSPQEIPTTHRSAADTQSLVNAIARTVEAAPEQFLWTRVYPG